MQFIKYHQKSFSLQPFPILDLQVLGVPSHPSCKHHNLKTKKQKNQEKNKKKSYSVIEAPNNTAITWKIAADPNTKNISFKTWAICKMTNKMIIHIVYGIYEAL